VGCTSPYLSAAHPIKIAPWGIEAEAGSDLRRPGRTQRVLAPAADAAEPVFAIKLENPGLEDPGVEAFSFTFG
jgi:hypothetical protein